MSNQHRLITNLERTEISDAYFAIFGRALTIATRFDAGCRTLGILVGIKNAPEILESEEVLKKFANRITKQKLWDHINNLTTKGAEPWDTLNKARIARNEIAHEITLGLDGQIDAITEKILKERIERLYNLCLLLAEGDILVEGLASDLTDEELPTVDFLKKYPERIAKWVTEI